MQTGPQLDIEEGEMSKDYSIVIEEVDNSVWLRYTFSDKVTPANDRIVRRSFDDMAALAAGLEINLNEDDAK